MTRLVTVLARCPALLATAGYVHRFAEMMKTLAGHHLPKWICQALAEDLPDLHVFVGGLQRDRAAATAGLTLPWSSGMVEGHVNRIKTIKRQMYGRAGLDLLRQRILLPD